MVGRSSISYSVSPNYLTLNKIFNSEQNIQIPKIHKIKKIRLSELLKERKSTLQNIKQFSQYKSFIMHRIYKKFFLQNSPLSSIIKDKTMNQISFIIFIFFICVGFANNPSNQNGLLEFNHIKSVSCMADCLQCLNGPDSCTKCTEGAECCNWACLECENQITCKDCIEGFKLNQKLNVCVSESPCQGFCQECDDQNQICLQCFEGYFFNKEMLTCQICAPKCIQCQSLDNCSLCNQKSYLQNGLCLDCQQHCQACISGTNCTLCQQSYYIDPVGMCQKCIAYCDKCTSGNSCDQCRQKSYYNADENKCLPCPEACSKCRNSNECFSCESGFYYNKTLKTCQKCNQFYPNCIECRNTSSLNTINAVADTICLKCQERYYVLKNQCVNCPQHCSQCLSTNNCTSCFQRYFVNDSRLCEECKVLFCALCNRKDQCAVCQTGFYWDSNVTQLRCLKCPYGCKECDKYSCKICLNGLYLKNSNCYRCDSGCFSCASQPYECSSCMPGYFKVEYNIGRCIKCAQPCLQCRNMTQCTTCIYGFYQDGGVCKKCEIEGCDYCNLTQEIQNRGDNLIEPEAAEYNSSKRRCLRCSLGYLLVNSICEKCLDGCQNCYSLEMCIKCSRGYALNADDTKCVKCPQHTLSCSINPFNSSQITIYECKHGYVRDAKINQCVPCIENCKFCPQGSPGQFCLDCIQGYYKSYAQTKKCLPCTQPCETCSSSTECLTCVIGYYMNQKDQCIKCGQGCEECQSDACFVCEEGYLLNILTLKCDKCQVDNCLTCKSSLQKCDTCDHGFIYYDASTNLSTSSNPNDDSQQPLCYRCDEQIQGCKSCDSPFLCTQCFSGLELVNEGDNNAKNSCVLSSKQENQLLLFAIIGVLALLCLVLIGTYSNKYCLVCIFITRRKLPKTLNNKIIKPNEIQTLIQTSQQSISPIDTVISSSSSYGKKSSVFNSFTAIN